MDADVYVIGLRIVHILSGVFWVGSALLFFYFIEPGIKATGPAGQEVMGHLVGKRKMPIVITAASTLTVLAGLLLYWNRSAGLSSAWITSSTGLTFTLGGIAAIGAWAMGLVVIKPAVDRMGAIGAEVQASGGGPSEAQAAELQRLERKLHRVGATDVWLLIFAVLAMAVARYV